MKKGIWKVHLIAQCLDCKWGTESLNGQGTAAIHAKKYGHRVKGEVGLVFQYDGRNEVV